MHFSTAAVFVSTFLGCWLFTSQDVFAWGAGMHIAQGEFVLNNLSLILPAIADLLRVYPLDFLYGCISADIFIGKGSRKRENHCHNWSMGHQLLFRAQEPFEKAFTYGYLSHLAADTVAHNFFIPNQLYRTSSTRKFGHVYWECRSDIFTERKYWRIAKNVIACHNPRDDDIIKRLVPHRVLSFKTKKHIYRTTIHLYNLHQWRRAVTLFSRNSRWNLTREYVEFLKNLSFALTIDFLDNPATARCLQYDPVGSYNIQEAKRMRRLMKRLNGHSPDDIGFVIPDDLLEVAALMEPSNTHALPDSLLVKQFDNLVRSGKKR